MTDALQKTGGIMAILGIDTSQPAEYLNDRALPDANNVEVNRNVLKKRSGTSLMGTTMGEEIMALREFMETGIRYVVRMGLTKIEEYDDGTGTWTDICPATNSFIVYADSYVVSTANNKLNFNIGADELTATITPGTYTIGVNQTTAGSLCKAVYDAIVAAEATGTYTVVVTSKKIVITRTAGTFQILWHTGTNGADGTDTHIGTLLGFDDTADSTGALTYTGASVAVIQNNKIDFNIGAGELVATVAAGTYVMGVTQATAGSLCKAIYDAIVAAEAAGTYTVTWNATTGLITIARTAGTFQIKWHTGTNGADNLDTHIGTLIGYLDTADDTGGLSYASDTIVYRPLTGTTADVIDTAVPQLSGARILVFTNMVDAIRKYTGTGNTANLGGSPPNCKYLVDYKGYLVLAYISSSLTMRVQWSDTLNIEEWTTGDAGYVDLAEEGEPITGLAVYGNYITVHKRSAIYLGYLAPTSSIFQFDRKTTGAGTICNATIQELPTGEQIFLAEDGLRIFNGVSAPLVESSILDDLREGVNPEYFHKSHSVVVKEKDEYWLFVPIGSQTTPDTVYKYNYKTGRILKDTRANITASFLFTRISQPTWNDITTDWDNQSIRWDDISILALAPTVGLGDNAGLSYKHDTTVNNDNAAAISAYITTKDYEAGEKGRLARWLQVEIWAKGNSLKVEYSTDGGVTWTECSGSPFTLGGDYPVDSAPQIAYMDVVSSRIRFKFSNATLAETFKLKQWVVGYKNREARK